MEATKTWTLRPTESIRALVEDAMKATGKKRQTIILEVIQQWLPELVRRKAQERKEAEQRFLEGGSESKE